MAVTRRTSTLMVAFPPTRSKERSSPSTRSSFTCVAGSISPISSKNNVPPLACSKRPIRLSDAPVKAPFSCPNNSLSSNCGESAAQCTATNFPFGRSLSACKACAASSLPVPLSPEISTVARVGATWRRVSYTSCIGAESPTSRSRPKRLSTCFFNSTTSFSAACERNALFKRSSNLSILTGLGTKSYAPLRIASTAVSNEPYAVIISTTGR